MYVDDLELLVTDYARGLADKMVRPMQWLLNAFETVLEFEVHDTKLVVMAKSQWVAEDLVRKLGRLVTAKHTKMLEADFAPGRRRTSATAAAFRKAANRVPKLQALKRAGGESWKIGRTGIAPAINYSLSVNGRSDSQLEAARKLVGASAFTGTRGRSLTLSYLLHPASDLDPTFAAHRGPILAWAKAAWEQSRPKVQMRLAFEKALKDQKYSVNPWQLVHGPAGATVASLKRLGWEPKEATVWATNEGVKSM